MGLRRPVSPADTDCVHSLVRTDAELSALSLQLPPLTVLRDMVLLYECGDFDSEHRAGDPSKAACLYFSFLEQSSTGFSGVEMQGKRLCSFCTRRVVVHLDPRKTRR